MAEVIVYSSPTCSNCDAVKEFLKENGVEYTDCNIARDLEAAERLINKTGQCGLPVIEINNEIIIGFDKRRIAKILEFW